MLHRRRLLVCLLTLALTACGGATPAAPSGVRPTFTPHVIKRTPRPGTATAPAVPSPTIPPPTTAPTAAGWIAYSYGDSSASGERDVYLMRPDGTDRRRLTQLPGAELAPIWSPDGTQVVFTATEGSPEPGRCVGTGRLANDCFFDIYVINADGSNLRRLMQDIRYDHFASWAPDGRSIVMESKGYRADCAYICYTHIVEVDVATGDQRILTDAPLHDYGPMWSPDGQHLAFTREDAAGSWHIYALERETQAVQRLTPEASFDGWPVWSPDGSMIAYMNGSRESPEGTLSLMTPAGTLLQTIPVPRAVRFGFRPTWAPDGQSLAFIVEEGGTQHIYAVDIDGQNLRQISHGTGRFAAPAWAPATQAGQP